jgi:transcriptional regulator GlxA family with amidase domain
MNPTKPRVVVFTTFGGMRVLDLTGPLDAFSFANDLAASSGAPPYRLAIVSEAGGPLRTSAGLDISTEPLSALDGTDIDTLIVAGGAAALRRESDPATVARWIETHRELVAWIARRAPGVRRVCSVCTGTFLLGAAGLLDGRTAATHWASAKLLADCFPRVEVDSDRIFVRHGPVWSSGGVTSGIDLALALIEEDLGGETALMAARVMVVFLKRPGGQSQFSVPLAAQSSDRGDFSSLHAWMWENLAYDLRVDQLAAQAGMSRRSFMRNYAAATGSTPAKTIEAMRVEAARAAIEDKKKSLKQVARQVGFGDEDRMRRVFLRRLGVTPADYRSRFSPHAKLPRAGSGDRLN